jgi:hypothetical protein
MGGLARRWLWVDADPDRLGGRYAMGERGQAPGSSGGKPGDGPDALAEDREDALIRKVLRAQEQHREGGLEPGLDETDDDPGPGA